MPDYNPAWIQLAWWLEHSIAGSHRRSLLGGLLNDSQGNGLPFLDEDSQHLS